MTCPPAAKGGVHLQILSSTECKPPFLKAHTSTHFLRHAHAHTHAPSSQGHNNVLCSDVTVVCSDDQMAVEKQPNGPDTLVSIKYIGTSHGLYHSNDL